MKNKNNELLKSYGNGFKILLKMGFIPSYGLGKNNDGIKEPILPKIYKRGEGLKTDKNEMNMSLSRFAVRDDYLSDDENDESKIHKDINNSELNFEKSEIFKSDYNLPELYELIHDLKHFGIKIPIKLLEIIDSKTYSKDFEIQLKMKLWDLLKDIKIDSSKMKYLNFQISNLAKDKEMFEISIRALNEFKKIFSNGNFEDFLKIEGIENLNTDLRIDISNLFVSKISKSWSDRVENLNCKDLNELGNLLDLGLQYFKIFNYLNGFKSISYISVNKGKIHFSSIDSILIKSLIFEKIRLFYLNDWEVEDINLGVGIYEEFKDCEIWRLDILNRILVDNIILIRIKQEINVRLELTQDSFKWILEWFTVLNSEYFDIVIEQIFNKYCEYIKQGYCDVYDLDYEGIGLSYWLNISNNRYLEEIIKSIKSRQVFEIRKVINIEEYWDLVNDDAILKNVQSFLKFVDDEKLIYKEICIPYWYGMRKLIEEEDSDNCLIYLNKMVINFSQFGILENEGDKVNDVIIKMVYDCYEELNFMIGDFRFTNKKDLNCFISTEEILQMYNDLSVKVGKDEKNNTDVRDEVIKKNDMNMKEVVFEECGLNGISIIPVSENEGKQVYNLNGQYDIYFGDRVVYIKESGFDNFIPVSIQEMFGKIGVLL